MCVCMHGVYMYMCVYMYIMTAWWFARPTSLATSPSYAGPWAGNVHVYIRQVGQLPVDGGSAALYLLSTQYVVSLGAEAQTMG